MSDDTQKRIDDLLAGRRTRPEPTVESALGDWLNDVAIQDAAMWLDAPSDDFSNGFAAAVLGLCGSLPTSFLDYALEPRRLAVLGKLRQRADAADRAAPGQRSQPIADDPPHAL